MVGKVLLIGLSILICPVDFDFSVEDSSSVQCLKGVFCCLKRLILDETIVESVVLEVPVRNELDTDNWTVDRAASAVEVVASATGRFFR